MEASSVESSSANQSSKEEEIKKILNSPLFNGSDYWDIPLAPNGTDLSLEEEKALQERIRNSDLEVDVIASVFEEFAKKHLEAFDKYRGQIVKSEDEFTTGIRKNLNFAATKLHLLIDRERKDLFKNMSPEQHEEHEFHVTLGKNFLAMLKENYPEEWSTFMLRS